MPQHSSVRNFKVKTFRIKRFKVESFKTKNLRLFPVLCCCAAFAITTLTAADSRAGDLVIVIDDLGYNLDRAQRILDWPQPMTLGVLPYAPHAQQISARAAALGREVILHQPMEPEPSAHSGAGHTHRERGMLELGMSAERIDAQLNDALARVPQAVGVNNHTGSRLTANRTSMERLMPLIRIRGPVFSRQSHHPQHGGGGHRPRVARADPAPRCVPRSRVDPRCPARGVRRA